MPPNQLILCHIQCDMYVARVEISTLVPPKRWSSLSIPGCNQPRPRGEASFTAWSLPSSHLFMQFELSFPVPILPWFASSCLRYLQAQQRGWMRSWGILCLSVLWTMFTQLSCHGRQAVSGSSSHHVLSPAFYPWTHSTPPLLMGSCVGRTALGTGGKLIKTNRATDAKTFACRGGSAVWKPGQAPGEGQGLAEVSHTGWTTPAETIHVNARLAWRRNFVVCLSLYFSRSIEI